MLARIVSVSVAIMIAFAMTGCSTSPEPGTGSTPPAGGDAASGTRLAPGLYDLEDGTVQALGTLEYRNLEGGLWAIVGGTEADGNVGDVVAVVANPDAFAGELKALAGKTVIATGTRSNGASIRMAGPEIVVETIQEIKDTAGPAE